MVEHFVFGLAAGTWIAAQDGQPIATGTGDAAYYHGAATGSFAVSTLEVPPCPDLTIAAVELNPPVPPCGEPLYVRALVQNIGQVEAGSFRAQVVLDGNVRCAWSFPSLAAGGVAWSPNCALGVLTSGTHDLEICVDSESAVDEDNETNNCR